MAYNHGWEERKWRLSIRIDDRADFNSNRRFYRRLNDVAEYLEEMAGNELHIEAEPVADLLDEIKMKICIGHCLRWTSVPCKSSC